MLYLKSSPGQAWSNSLAVLCFLGGWKNTQSLASEDRLEHSLICKQLSDELLDDSDRWTRVRLAGWLLLVAFVLDEDFFAERLRCSEDPPLERAKLD